MLIYSPLEQFDTINILPLFIGALDISFATILLPLLIVDGLLLLIVIFYKKETKLVPDF